MNVKRDWWKGRTKLIFLGFLDLKNISIFIEYVHENVGQ